MEDEIAFSTDVLPADSNFSTNDGHKKKKARAAKPAVKNVIKSLDDIEKDWASGIINQYISRELELQAATKLPEVESASEPQSLCEGGDHCNEMTSNSASSSSNSSCVVIGGRCTKSRCSRKIKSPCIYK